jgi:PAS domain-containing protein/two-component sensor histidine kinase
MERDGDAIIHVTHDGKVTSWNAEAQGLFLLTALNGLGADLATLIVPHDQRVRFRARFAEFAKSAWDEPQDHFEADLLSGEGRRFPAQIRVVHRRTLAGGGMVLHIREQPEGSRVIRDAAGDGERRQGRIDDMVALLQSVFEHVPVGAVICDTEGRLRFMNPASKLVLGTHAPGTAFSTAWAKVTTLRGDPVPSNSSAIALAWTGRGPHHEEVYCPSQGNGRLALRVTAIPLRERGGALLGCLGILEAQQQQQQAAVQNVMFDILFRPAADGIAFFDAQGRIRRINPAARRLALLDPVGQPPESLEAVWGEVQSPDGHRLSLDEWPIARAVKGEFVAGCELRIVTLTGRTRHLLVSAYPIYIGKRKMVGGIAIFTDIARLKKEEAALKTSLGSGVLRLRDHLRILASILRLPAAASDPDQAARRTLHYIAALLQLEDQLAKSDPHACVPMEAYLGRLVKSLLEAEKQSTLQVAVAASDIDMEPTQASYLGLGVTRLVLGALQDVGATLELYLQRWDDQYELGIRHSGAGLDGLANVDQGVWAGWETLHLLVERLKGEVMVDTSNGRTLRLLIPAPPPERSRTGQGSARQHPRVSVRHPVVCRQQRGDTKQNPRILLGEIRDVSAGGAQIAVNSQLKASEQVELTAMLEGQTFLALAEIVSASMEAEKDAKGRLRYGLKWQSLAMPAAEILARMLSSGATQAGSAEEPEDG